MFGWYLASVLLLALAVNAVPSRDLDDDAEKYLLPWNIRPEHYDLTIHTNIENFDTNDAESFQFSGISEITFLVLYGDVDQVVLHTYDNVQIASASIVSLDIDKPVGHTVVIGGYDKETNKQSFHVTPALSNNGRYRITIYYTGYNTDSLTGFYRSSYFDENNNIRWLLTTQFEDFGARQAYPCFDEPEYKATYQLTLHYNQSLADRGYLPFFNTDIQSEQIRWLVTTDLEFFGARRAFPCLDEPEYKATFKLTMKFNATLTNQGYRSFFNAPVESEQIVNGMHVTTFKKTTLPLSTYLVAFIIAPFDISPEPAFFHSSYNGENPEKPFRTIGQPKFFTPKRQDLLSQVAGPAALNLMTKLTGVGYGYEKVEQAGIPDFAAGAMENWGLVTYREGYVFWNNETGSTSQRQGVASVITHELAHQWFGDLVTTHWWSDLWLNEGFATFFEYMGTDQFREPDLDTSDWNLEGQFVSGNLEGSAFRTDGRPTSRPLTSEAYNPDVIETFGDSISYDKGGAVLRMFHNILGTSIYYAGLNRYLTSQEESVGTPEILLASWDGAIDALPAQDRPNWGRSVAVLLEAWHNQAGYPVLFVSRTGDILSIAQKRFLSSSGDDSPRWNVPITYSTDLENNFNLTSPSVFLLAEEEQLILPLKVASSDWVVINNKQTGYYRVNYDQSNWDKLFTILSDDEQYKKIHEYNRAQILDDAAALGASTHSEYLPYRTVLGLLQVLRHDSSLAVWTTAIRIMRDLLTHLQATPQHYQCYESLRNYCLDLVTNSFNELTLYVTESDSHERKLRRALVGDFACHYGLSACEQQAHDLFHSSFHPDVRKIVLCERIKMGDDAEWYEFFQLATGSSSDKINYLLALTCTKNDQLVIQLLNILSSRKLFSNDNDAVTVLQELLDRKSYKATDILNVIDSRRWKIGSVSRKFNKLKVDAEVIAVAYGADVPIDKPYLRDEVNHRNQWMAMKQPQICDFLSRRN